MSYLIGVEPCFTNHPAKPPLTIDHSPQAPLTSMPFDSLTLAAVVMEFREDLLGDRLTSIYQPDSRTVVLAFQKKQRILLSIHTDYARAHCTRRKLAHPGQPPSFCMLLR